MKIKAIIILVLQLTALVVADINQEDGKNSENIEEKLIKKMDEFNRMDTIDIYDDMITLERVAEDKQPSEESKDPLVRRIEKFLRTRKIQINFPNDSSTAGLFGRALNYKNIDIELKSLTHGKSEARTKLKKMILPLLLLLKLKALIILPVIIATVAFISIKGLNASFLSLLFSAAIGLKALLTPPPPPRVTYGVARPHEIHHDHWHRSEQEVNQPYRGWAPDYNGDQYAYHDIP